MKTMKRPSRKARAQAKTVRKGTAKAKAKLVRKSRPFTSSLKQKPKKSRNSGKQRKVSNRMAAIVSPQQKIQQLPIPSHFNPAKVGEVWKVPYQDRANEAWEWAKRHSIKKAATDRLKIGLLPIDVQNTFCIPRFELFVAGQSGMGAVHDNVRLGTFIYWYLGVITEILPTMDTHTGYQTFDVDFFIDDDGNHPAPFTFISHDDIVSGKWKANPAMAAALKTAYQALQNHLLHYTKTLKDNGKFALQVWPYHAIRTGISYSLVSAIDEAIWFHSKARSVEVGVQIKGGNPWTENYSIIKPEVLTTAGNKPIAQKNTKFIKQLMDFDRLIITGQAKGHCVAWSIDDLLTEIKAIDPSLAKKVYILEDCTSPVVVPGYDSTDEAAKTFERFKNEGMHIVKSTDPIESWPDMDL